MKEAVKHTLVLGAEEYFTHLHDVGVNQKYAGNLPYSFHLKMVYKQAVRFSYLLVDLRDKVNALIGAWGHDSMEDGRLTYNDLCKKWGKDTAEIVYLCTDFKGKTRAERKPVELYTELGSNKVATFVKLCDLMANIQYSMLEGHSMFEKYKKEWESNKMRDYAYFEDFEPMYEYIDWLFTNPEYN